MLGNMGYYFPGFCSIVSILVEICQSHRDLSEGAPISHVEGILWRQLEFVLGFLTFATLKESFCHMTPGFGQEGIRFRF
jgi:hypothetical protein